MQRNNFPLIVEHRRTRMTRVRYRPRSGRNPPGMSMSLFSRNTICFFSTTRVLDDRDVFTDDHGALRGGEPVVSERSPSSDNGASTANRAKSR